MNTKRTLVNLLPNNHSKRHFSRDFYSLGKGFSVLDKSSRGQINCVDTSSSLKIPALQSVYIRDRWFILLLFIKYHGLRY